MFVLFFAARSDVVPTLAVEHTAPQHLLDVFPAHAELAQERDAQGREVRYNSRTEIDFDGVDVQGELVKPAGQLLLDRRKANFNPLIRLREHFNDEMKRSVDQVK